MLLSRWKMMAGVLGVTLGGLAAVAGQCPKMDSSKTSRHQANLPPDIELPKPSGIPSAGSPSAKTPAAPSAPAVPAAPAPGLPSLPTVELPPAPPAAQLPEVPKTTGPGPQLPTPTPLPATTPATPPLALPAVPATPVIPASGTDTKPLLPPPGPAPTEPTAKPTPPVASPTPFDLTPSVPETKPTLPKPTQSTPSQSVPSFSPPAPPAIDPAPVLQPTDPLVEPSPRKSPKPDVSDAPKATATKYRILLRVGEGEPTFEVKYGDDLVLKVICEKIDIKSPEKGAAGLSAVKASGKVRFVGFGAEGTCEELSFLAGTGEVSMAGAVKIQVKDKLGRIESELSTETMKYKIDPSAALTGGKP